MPDENGRNGMIGWTLGMAVAVAAWWLLSLLPPVTVPSLPAGLVSALVALAKVQVIFVAIAVARTWFGYPRGERMRLMVFAFSLEASLMVSAVAIAFLILAH